MWTILLDEGGALIFHIYIFQSYSKGTGSAGLAYLITSITVAGVLACLSLVHNFINARYRNNIGD